jgi:hypothetical protein
MMRARLKPSAITTKAQKKAIDELLEQEMKSKYQKAIRRFFKLMCVSLNEDFGFGEKRLMRLITRISAVSAEHEHDEVYWTHVDRRIEQLGLEFSKEDDNEG